MFNIPKNAIYKRINRRKFLELGGGVATALGTGSLAVGLNSTIMKTSVQASSSPEAKWKQYAGSKLVFMSENTPPSFAIRDTIKEFFDLTGITVEVLTDDLPVVLQKVGIDVRGGKADFPVFYSQDKPIGAALADYCADLGKFIKDDTLPQDPEGYGADSWFDNFLDACGSMYEKGKIVALPYDAAIACTFYRQDVFEKHSKDFEKEYKYRMEFNAKTTWKNVLDYTTFLQKMKKAGQDVPYGYAQHLGTFAWTTQLDIQRMMYSHGQWLDFKIDDILGSKKPGPTNWGDASSIEMMKQYKALADVCHPDNLANGTLELNTVYQSGQIAMQIQYHEFAASVEDEKTSKAAGGKTAYAPCPLGEASWIKNGGKAVNGTNCGIGGIAINKNASEDIQRAAFIFATYATSKKLQYNVLKGLGGTPTRKSVLAEPDVVAARKRPTKMPNALTFEPVYDFGIKAPNFVLGPKIPEVNEYHKILHAEVSKCVAGKQSPEDACKAMGKQTDNVHDI